MIRVTDDLAVTLRHYTSISHIQSAAVTCRQTWAAQQAWPGTGSGGTFDEIGWNVIQANASAAVYLSVAFLEASINELFADAASGVQRPELDALGQRSVQNLARTWTKKFKRNTRMIIKYQTALQVVGMPTVSDQSLLDDVELLVQLRNDLTHAEPGDETVISSITGKPLTAARLEQEIAKRVTKNPKISGVSSFLSDYLAHPLAEWSLRRSLKFADAFWAALGIKAPYDHVRSRLLARA